MIISCPNCTSRFNLNAALLGETGRNVKCAKCAHRWFAKPQVEGAEAPPPSVAPVAAPAPPAAPPPVAPAPPAEKPPATAPAPEDKAEDSDAGDEEKKAKEEKEKKATAKDAGEAKEKIAEAEAEAAETPSPPPIPTEEEIARFQIRPPASKSTIFGWIALFVVVVCLVTGTVIFRLDIVAFYPPSSRLFLAVGLPTDTLGHGLKINDPKMSRRADGDDRILVIKGEIENETGDVIDVPLLRGAVKNTRGEELRVWSFKSKDPRVLAGEKITYETEVRNPPRGATQLSITFTREAEMTAEKKRVKEAAAKSKAAK